MITDWVKWITFVEFRNSLRINVIIIIAIIIGIAVLISNESTFTATP